MFRSTLTGDEELFAVLCPFCKKGIKEDIWHMMWDCEAWDNVRKPFMGALEGAVYNATWKALGILPESAHTSGMTSNHHKHRMHGLTHSGRPPWGRLMTMMIAAKDK